MRSMAEIEVADEDPIFRRKEVKTRNYYPWQTLAVGSYFEIGNSQQARVLARKASLRLGKRFEVDHNGLCWRLPGQRRPVQRREVRYPWLKCKLYESFEMFVDERSARVMASRANQRYKGRRFSVSVAEGGIVCTRVK